MDRTRSQRARSLIAWAVTVVAVVLPWSATAPSRAQTGEVSAAGRGGEQLYQLYCATCHGTDGAGIPGAGVGAGPPLRGLEVAYVDQVLRTGRMPILEPSVGVVDQPRFTDGERAGLVAWTSSAFDLVGDLPVMREGSVAHGQELYGRHCAACHGSTGSGGTSGDGVTVPPVRGLDPVAVFEATRVGPFEMPRFEAEVLTDEEVWDVVAFTQEMTTLEATPLGIREMNRVTMTVMAGLLLLAVLGVVLVTGRPVPVPEKDD